MATCQLSRLAEEDLLEIGSYTLREWGPDQAFLYLGLLDRATQRLADHPMSGRPCDRVRRGLRRMEQGRHVIFYRLHEDGILVSRILHGSMLPEMHEMED